LEVDAVLAMMLLCSVLFVTFEIDRDFITVEMTGWDEMYTYGYGDSLYKFIYGWVAGFGIWYSVGEEHGSMGVQVQQGDRKIKSKRRESRLCNMLHYHSLCYGYGGNRREIGIKGGEMGRVEDGECTIIY
jgi:hypothetical protein